MTRKRGDSPETYRRKTSAKRKVSVEKLRRYTNEYKAARGCALCGERDPRCLDFHHRDRSEKKDKVSKLVAQRAVARMKEEIAKCTVICANCHRKLHIDESEA